MVFTLCDTPHSEGYSTSSNSISKLASRFLKFLVKPMMVLLPIPDFSTDFHAFRTAAELKNIQPNEKGEYKPSKSWDTLSSFVRKLEHQLELHGSLSLPLVIALNLISIHLLKLPVKICQHATHVLKITL
jgi:hypothetical protein